MSTLSVGFENFRKTLESPEAPADAILERQRIRAHVASAWQPVRDAVVGSFKRGTNLHPTREVDYLFVLGTRHQPYLTADPAKALDDIAARLGVAFHHVQPRRLLHGLGVPFHDMVAILIPAFPRHGGGLFIPDTELKRWIPTDTDAHAAHVKEVNRKTAHLGAATVRALKSWKRTRDVPVRGFHLETLALRALVSPPESLAAACVMALDGIAASVKQRCAPVGSAGDDVDMYLALDPARRAKIAVAAGDAADALRDAAAHDVQRDPVTACATARAVFGLPFPGE